MVVAVAIKLVDGFLRVFAREKVDEGEAARLVRLAVLCEVDALDGAWGGGWGVEEEGGGGAEAGRAGSNRPDADEKEEREAAEAAEVWGMTSSRQLRTL